VKISRIKRKRQPIGMLGRSSGNHDWLLANASALAFLAVFVYATHASKHRKRLRLNGNRALAQIFVHYALRTRCTHSYIHTNSRPWTKTENTSFSTLRSNGRVIFPVPIDIASYKLHSYSCTATNTNGLFISELKPN